MIVINVSIWALSYHRHGRITDQMAERARLARVSYAKTFLPDRFELRPSHEPGPAR